MVDFFVCLVKYCFFSVYNMQNRTLFHTLKRIEYTTEYQSGWVSSDDSKFLLYIYKNWIIVPANDKRNIVHTQSEKHFSQIGQSKLVDKVTNDMIKIFL